MTTDQIREAMEHNRLHGEPVYGSGPAKYTIYVTGFYQEECTDPLWTEPGPIPRDATVTGGDVQLCLDNYHHDDYDPERVLGETYATEREALEAAITLRGPDQHGVRLDFMVLAD